MLKLGGKFENSELKCCSLVSLSAQVVFCATPSSNWMKIFLRPHLVRVFPTKFGIFSKIQTTLVSFCISGITSNHPEEACEHFYFSPNTWTVSIIVAENSSSPCPFSGSYKVDGQPNKILQTLDAMEPKHLVQPEEKDTKVLPVDNCSTFIQAGCSHSHSLELETLCTDFQLPKKQCKWD